MKEQSVFLDLLKKWATQYLPDEEGKKPKTIKSYKASWRIFLRYMYSVKGIASDKVQFSDLSYETITDFLKWLEDVRKCGQETRNNRLAAISKFSEYAQNRDFDAAACFRKACLKIPYKHPFKEKERAFFTKEEVAILFSMPEPRGNMGYRDHVILPMLYATGCRAEELCSLMVGDIKFKDGEKATIHIMGKGGKSRTIKIPIEMSSMLENYIRKMRISNQPERYLFASQRNAKMTVSCLEQLFKKYVDKAKREYPSLFPARVYTPHSMRHTTAVHMLEAGVPLVVIKQFLGHSHLVTTEIYARMSQGSVNDRLERWDQEYWHNQYIDTTNQFYRDNRDDDSKMPSFLR